MVWRSVEGVIASNRCHYATMPYLSMPKKYSGSVQASGMGPTEDPGLKKVEPEPAI